MTAQQRGERLMRLAVQHRLRELQRLEREAAAYRYMACGAQVPRIWLGAAAERERRAAELRGARWS